jgi:hypothetical protein
MYTLIAIFYISMISIVTMLLLKRKEVNTGHPSIISRVGAGTDHIFSIVFSSIKRWISYWNKHTFIAISQWLAFHVLLRIRKIYVELKHRALVNPHTKKVIDAVRGRAEIRHEGASFYLRRISTDSSQPRIK